MRECGGRHGPRMRGLGRRPVLDGMVTGFKMAEMMADLKSAGVLTVSRSGWFEEPPKDDFKRMRSFMGRET